MPWPELLQQLQTQTGEIRAGGGGEAVQRQHAKGRLTARERIAALIDEDAPWLETGLWAAWRMYEEWGGAPSAGVVCGVAQVAGRATMVIANDATIKAGAFFPMTCKKVLRAQRMALENHLPLIYLVDSAGVFLPLQDEIFPDEDDFGRIFYHNALLSARGIPQLAAIMGNCVAGGGYLPVLCDKLVMTEGSGLYLAGPALVKSAIGQEVSHEELGGAQMHAAISGTIDFREPDDAACLQRLRRLADTWPADRVAPPFRRGAAREPQRPPEEIYGIVPADGRAAFDMRDVLNCLLDGQSFQEYKAEYGQTLVCGYARLGGYDVGVVASQRQQVKTRDRGMQFGGVIYDDSADKATRFIMDCNQNWLPLVFFQDVFGFMVGRASEQGGIIRAGAKLVNVVSNSRVPKITIITGGSFGAGHYALCGKAFAPRFIFAWPNAHYAVMGGKQATDTLLDINIAALKRAGQPLDVEQLEELKSRVAASYAQTTDIRYGASRGWVDAIITPEETRSVLVRALQLVTRHADDQPFRTGVLQV